MSPIEVAHSLPTGAAVATVAAEGYDLGSAVRAWAISRGVTDHYAVEAGGRRYVLTEVDAPEGPRLAVSTSWSCAGHVASDVRRYVAAMHVYPSAASGRA